MTATRRARSSCCPLVGLVLVVTASFGPGCSSPTRLVPEREGAEVTTPPVVVFKVDLIEIEIARDEVARALDEQIERTDDPALRGARALLDQAEPGERLVLFMGDLVLVVGPRGATRVDPYAGWPATPRLLAHLPALRKTCWRLFETGQASARLFSGEALQGVQFEASDPTAETSRVVDPRTGRLLVEGR